MRTYYMARTEPISFRIEPELKAAIERASRDDRRSVSSLVMNILTDWLRDRGYLPTATEVNRTNA